jgi:hypothetical protein
MGISFGRSGSGSSNPFNLNNLQNFAGAAKSAAGTIGSNKGTAIRFAKLPATAEEFTAMPEFNFSTPFQTAALFIVAICAFPSDPEACYNMIDALKGPQKMNQRERDFIRDRMRSKADYIGKAYFAGATPQNNYTPALPYRVEVNETPHTYDAAGYATVYIKSAGADSPRPVTLRQKGSEWYLWQHEGPLMDIRIPAALDPWA